MRELLHHSNVDLYREVAFRNISDQYKYRLAMEQHPVEAMRHVAAYHNMNWHLDNNLGPYI